MRWVLTVLVACGTGCRGTINCPATTATITYADVAPIFEAKCTACHATYRRGERRYGAPERFNYDTYQVAIEDPERLAGSVIGQSMPYGSVMSDHDACTIQAWVEQRTPQ